jgi:hypothetical protein
MNKKIIFIFLCVFANLFSEYTDDMMRTQCKKCFRNTGTTIYFSSPYTILRNPVCKKCGFYSDICLKCGEKDNSIIYLTEAEMDEKNFNIFKNDHPVLDLDLTCKCHSKGLMEKLSNSKLFSWMKDLAKNIKNVLGKAVKNIKQHFEKNELAGNCNTRSSDQNGVFGYDNIINQSQYDQTPASPLAEQQIIP